MRQDVSLTNTDIVNLDHIVFVWIIRSSPPPPLLGQGGPLRSGNSRQSVSKTMMVYRRDFLQHPTLLHHYLWQISSQDYTTSYGAYNSEPFLQNTFRVCWTIDFTKDHLKNKGNVGTTCIVVTDRIELYWNGRCEGYFVLRTWFLPCIIKYI